MQGRGNVITGALNNPTLPEDKLMTQLTQTLATRGFKIPSISDILVSIFRKFAAADRRHREINKLMRASPEHLADMGIDPSKIEDLYRT